MTLNVTEEKSSISRKHKPDLGRSGLLGGCDGAEICNDSIIPPDPNFDKGKIGMSSKFRGFKVFPNSFYQSVIWQSATIKYRVFFIEILMRCVWKKTSYIANGHLIELEVGSFACSLRNMVEMFNPKKKKGQDSEDEFSLNDIRGAIRFFTNHKILTQKVTHQITILSICDSDVYDSNFSFDNTVDNTKLTQCSHSHLKEPSNQITKKKKKNEKEKSMVEKKEFEEQVFLTEQQHQSLLKKHGEEFLNLMLEELSAYKCANGKKYVSDFHLMKGRGWLFQKCQKIIQEPKKVPRGDDIRTEVMKKFQNEEFYNEARCNIDQMGIGFQRGMKQRQVKFKDFGFWDQLRNILIDFGIKYEFTY
jgi:hypothetical protein